MKRFILILTCAIYIHLSLFSKEISVHSKSSFNDGEGITQANLSGIPSACIAGKVNVITGDFVQYDVDFTIPAQNALLIERSYSSSFGKKGSLAFGWSLNHCLALVTQYDYNTFTFYLNEGLGAFTKFKGELPIKPSRLFVSNESIDQGMTNCGSGEISGQTNKKNLCFFSEDTLKEFKADKIHSVYAGDGTRHFFKKVLKKDPFLTLVKTHYPNGNVLRYKRADPDKEKPQTLCELVSPVNDRLAEFKLVFEDDTHGKMNVVLAGDQKVTYTYSMIEGHKCLTYAEPPENPPIRYEYATTKKKDDHPRIVKTELPNKRAVEIGYWKHKERDRDGIKIHSWDNVLNRVKFLKEPVGETSELIQTYEFHYLTDKYGKAFSTEVLDVNKNKTVYNYFKKTQRLSNIYYFGQQSKIYREEEFTWGAGQDAGNLTSHLIYDQKGTKLLQHTYTYDKFGNPLHEKIFGNLTGKGGWEVHDKVCTFSNNAYNLKISEEEGRTKVLYTYFPGSNKVKTKFICDGNTVKERHFYDYNRHNLLISEAIDNGSGNTLEDKSNVTQCSIHFIQENVAPPVYLPMKEGDNYIAENGEERHKKWVENHYNTQNRLEIQDHYDCNDSLRYRLHWAYDNHGNVISEVNAAGEETARKYDENRNIVEEQGPNKTYHVEMGYDYMNRLIKVVKVDNRDNQRFTISHKYDTRGNRIATIDEYGNETSFEYDDFNRLSKTIAPPTPDAFGALFKAQQIIEYDVLNNPTVKINGAQHACHQLNTIRGQLYLITYPDGSQEKMVYNLNGTLKEKTEKNETTTKYTYDYKNRPTSTEIYSRDGRLLSSHQIEYNAFNPIKEIDAEGHITTFQYDRQGRLSAVFKEDGEVHYGYDDLSRRNSVKTFFGTALTDYTLEITEYDLRDRVIETRTEDAIGNILRKETCAYDGDGNKTRVDIHSKAGIGSTHFTYNIHGQPLQIKDAEGHITDIRYRYDYKDAHNLTVPYSESTDAKGNVTICIGNAVGKTSMIQKKNIFGHLTQQREFFYDGNQRLVETRETVLTPNSPERQVTTQWRYNAVDEVTDIIEAVGTPEQKHTTHCYNAYRQKITTHKPDGNIIHFSYDERGRLETVTSSDQSLSYSYTYDLNDNPTCIADHTNNMENLRAYDRNDRLIKETLGNALTIEYTYDRQGRMLTNVLPDQSVVEYTYNAVDLIGVKKKDAAGKEVYSQTYAYDIAGNVLEKHLPFGLGEITYEYDLLQRHRNTHAPHFSENQVEYDFAGNIISRKLKDPLGEVPCSYAYDDLYQIKFEEGTSSHTYEYDSLFNRVDKDGFKLTINSLNQLLQDKKGNYTYDPNGNLTERHDQKYGYDAWDRLISVTKENTKVTYQYDDLSRRLSKTFFSWDPLTNEWTKQDAQYFLYQKDNEIGQCDEQNNFSELRVLGHGKGAEIGSAIVYEIHGEAFVPIADYAGHTRVLLNVRGEPIDVYRYSTFGEETIQDAQGKTKSPSVSWRYCSKRYDSETELVYFGKRYYDPDAGHWITTDPLGYDEGPNLYAYLTNNPLTLVDLYGLRIAGAHEKIQARFDLSVKKETENHYKKPFKYNFQVEHRNFEDKFNAPERSRAFDLSDTGLPNLPNGMRVGLNNGIMGTFISIRNRALDISRMMGGFNIDVVHNRSVNFFVDVYESFLNLNYCATEPVRCLHENWDKFFASGSDKKYLQICHSQGAIHVRNALLSYPPELRDRILVVAIAPAAYIDPRICGGVMHYRAAWYRDPIPRINYSGACVAKDTIRTLPSHKDARLHDHNFDSPTYEDAINYHLKRYQLSGGMEL